MAMSRTARLRRLEIPVLLLFLLAVVAVAGIGGLASASGTSSWYDEAAKPWFTPPSWLFSPVWTLLYAAMAIAAWLLYQARVHAPRQSRSALRLWWAQLAVNFAWTPVFFALQLLWVGLFVILVLDVLVALLVVRAWRVHRVAGALLAPYLAWICYATALNAGVAALN